VISSWLYLIERMTSYSEDKRRIDRFEPEIKRILGEHLIETADYKRDATQATDLVVLVMESDITIGCRVRKYSYLCRFADEFTIRAERRWGKNTELRKIRDGWCKYGFYAFADSADEHLLQWTLYDWDVFRATLQAMPDSGAEFVEERLTPNHDDSSVFAKFKWKEFPSDMIVAQKTVLFEECPNYRCLGGKEWYRVPDAPNDWRTCTCCLGFAKVPLEEYEGE